MGDIIGMSSKVKNSFIAIGFSIVLGVICGAIIWVFLTLMNLGIKFLWTDLPGAIDFEYYTLVFCILSSFIIGFMHMKLGDYPEDMTTVMAKIKKDGQYDYRKLHAYIITAFVPLVVGASIGPEAGLVGIIAGLCSMVKHKFSVLSKQFSDIANIGFSAALAVVFQSPLFGFIEPIEDDNFKMPKRSKTVLYFSVILSAFGIFLLLKWAIPITSESVSKIDFFSAGQKEYIFFIPCALIGYVLGLVYMSFETLSEKIFGLLKDHHMIKALIGGTLLGLAGTFLPYTMFSGEHQIAEISAEWESLGAAVLILTGLVKMLITTTCISSGFKGGHFFPVIFSGISLGYGFALLFDLNPAFTCAVITASIMSTTLRKPVASAILLLLCFPTNSLLTLIAAAVVGAILPLPKALSHEETT